MNNKIQNKLAVLTSDPGVYIMKNANDDIIYVGKAKNLKNRVSQYFVANSQHSPKVLRMVSNIDHFEYIVTDSELEALILENNLIKQHKPKYNILLKDDKTYPFIALNKNSDYPRFTLSRKRSDPSFRYFGPFQSSKSVWDIIRTINAVFGLYGCNHVFPRDFNKFRPCLNYHIGKCVGICTGKISSAEYKENVSQAVAFLNDDYKKVLSDLESEMLCCSKDLNFEKAAVLRDRIDSIKRLESKQIIVLSPDVNRDIIAHSELEDEICFSVMHIRQGKLLFQDTVFISDSSDDIIGVFIERYYQQKDIIPKEIAVEHMPKSHQLLSQWLSSQRGSLVKLFEAKKGESARLIEMCRKNALEKLAEKRSNGVRSNKLMGQIAQMLGISKIPSRIEMYDISHFGGDSTVGGMVVWENGRFRKSEYKKFKFDDAVQDDYKHTYEMIERRLKRLDSGSEGFNKAPDIIFLDGGAGHLNAVYELVSKRNINIFGLVKDRKHRTRACVSIKGEVDLRVNPAVFKFFTNLQDEVHRYAISYMQKKKSGQMFSSELMSVPGVGKARYKSLMDHFKTIDNLKNAGVEEISKINGVSNELAEKIYNSLREV